MTAVDYIRDLYVQDDICRAQPLRSEAPCPRCGYLAAGKPPWADIGASFALAGSRYRIVSVGSTNRYAPRGLHFEDTVLCERVDDERWAFPKAPCPVSDIQVALTALFELPHFRPHELSAAYMIEEKR